MDARHSMGVIMTDRQPSENLDVSNVYGIGVQAKNVVILAPPRSMTADEAMVFVAWIVALASMDSKHPFETYYDKVCNT